MSVTLPPSLARTLEQVRVGVTRVAEAAAQQTGEKAAPAVTPVEQPSDAYGVEEAMRQAWSQRFTGPTGVGEAAPPAAKVVGCVSDVPQAAPEIGGWDEGNTVLQQTKDSNCGSAVAVMLGKPSGASPTEAENQEMDALESRFTDGTGTSAKEMSDMLANKGSQVTQSSAGFDRGMMDEALKRDGKAAVLVDSNKVDPTAKDAGPGRAHWVTVDGKDDQGNYKVKDPGTGKSVTLGADKLEDAVGTSWREHKGGGMLVVEKAEGTSEAERAERGGQQVAALGTTEGGGSRAKANFARESS